MIKKSIGKLRLGFMAMAEDMGVEVLSFDGFDAIQLGTLELHNKDPFRPNDYLSSISQ